MNDGSISERILDEVKKQSGDDHAVSDFLIDLLYRESQHLFRWKDTYRKAIEQAAKNWSENDEN